MKDLPLLDIAREYEIVEQYVEDTRRDSVHLATGARFQGRHGSESLGAMWPFFQLPYKEILWEAKEAVDRADQACFGRHRLRLLNALAKEPRRIRKGFVAHRARYRKYEMAIRKEISVYKARYKEYEAERTFLEAQHKDYPSEGDDEVGGDEEEEVDDGEEGEDENEDDDSNV
ncbi:MAG: hypothetical protein M1830_006716 [Pleopsidium flavum]|nr:MAG: hypothetical protein M1830_006716 [Pleopsidium flavum]